MKPPLLFLVGANHRTAPFGFREKLALGAEGEAALAVELTRSPSIREFVILNTCNRVEIYAVGNDATTTREVAAIFCEQRGVAPQDFDRFGFVLTGREAVEHLLEVAAGLDSQILGETEIFGQAKQAYANAQTRGSAGPILNRLFQKAFQAAKHVRTHTGVGTGQVSIATVAVDLAGNVFGQLEDAKVLLLGAGEIAGKSARAFQSRGARHVRVASRRLERAQALAQSLHATATPFEDRESHLADADIVVCSTSSPKVILSLAATRAAMRRRPARPLLFIDLAMPRNVDTAVVQLENVFLYNLDDLALVASRNRQARLAQAQAGRLALAPRIDSLWNQLQLQFATLLDQAPQRLMCGWSALPAFPTTAVA